MCHVLCERFCCSCIYTKIEKNTSQLFKEFYFTDLPVSAMMCRLDFPCFVGVHLRAFSTLPG